MPTARPFAPVLTPRAALRSKDGPRSRRSHPQSEEPRLLLRSRLLVPPYGGRSGRQVVVPGARLGPPAQEPQAGGLEAEPLARCTGRMEAPPARRRLTNLRTVFSVPARGGSGPATPRPRRRRERARGRRRARPAPRV